MAIFSISANLSLPRTPRSPGLLGGEHLERRRGISTPYRKLGLLHQKHRDHFGVDGDGVLVVQGASKTFNPSLADATIAAQRAADPTAAARVPNGMRRSAATSGRFSTTN